MVKFGKIKVRLVKLDVLGIIGRFNLEKLAPRLKALILGTGPIGHNCVIRPVGVQLGWFHSSRSYSKAFGASQCRWFNYWSLSGILFILQAFTPSRETILRKDKTERL